MEIRRALQPKNPRVRTFLTLRKSIGILAWALPFAVAIPYYFAHQILLSSISAYYYTGSRNYFVGTLCAVGLFMFCNRGYGPRDEGAAYVSAVCAFGVAFFPTTPDPRSIHCDCSVVMVILGGHLHLTFAAILFLTLAYFCLRLFTLSAVGVEITYEKHIRNRVYIGCGWTILISMAVILILSLCPQLQLRLKWPCPKLPFDAFFETTSLLAFGTAWLVKGEAIWFLNDGGLRQKTSPAWSG